METFDLFVSYGRYDADMPIIEKIKKYLENHCKTLWVDKDQIEAADDWREAIYLGIKNSRNVLALLSNYSSRDRCVCLDELAIAVSYPEKILITVLLDPEDQVKIPTSVARKQWIDFSSWKQRKADGEEDFEKWFNRQMQNVLEIIESKENKEFQGDIRTLRQILVPNLNDTKFHNLLSKKFSGRKWAIRDFDSFLENKTAKRFLYIFGSPGCGKSHLAAHLAHWNHGVAAGYFIEWDRQYENSIHEFIYTVAFLLATRIPDYRQALKKMLRENVWNGELSEESLYNAKTALDKRSKMDLMDFLVIKPISDAIDGELDNQIIVIDGLDEACYENLNPLLKLLANPAMDKLPRWLKFAVSFRNEPEILREMNQMRMEKINLDSDLNKDDIYEFLCERLSKNGFNTDFIREISNRCEQSFVFAEKLCEAVEDGIIESDSLLEDIPTNISGLYYFYFDERLFEGKNYDEMLNPLNVLVANGGKITREQLKFVMKWDNRKYSLFMDAMRSFVLQSNNTNFPTLSFFHKSIGDWLTNVDESGQYAVDLPSGEKLILDACYAAYQSKHYKRCDYDVQKFIYESICRFGSIQEREIVDLDFEYLQEMQFVSYLNSDFELSQKYFDTITSRYSSLPKDKQPDCEAWVARAYIIRCEIDMAGGKDVMNDMEQIKKDFPNAATNCPDIYASIEINIMFQGRLKDIDQAKRRCEELYSYIEKHDFQEKGYYLGKLDYHHGIILYELGKRDKKYYREALTYLNRAIKSSNQGRTADGAKKFEMVVMNQIGMTYCWLRQYDEALKILKNSLKKRKEYFGTYSMYTSVGYDNLVRAKLEMAGDRNIPLEERVYNDVHTALKIDDYIFGRKTPTTARHLQTLALVCKHNAKYGQQCVDEGLEAAKEALEIFRASDAVIYQRPIEQTKKLIESLKSMKGSH